MPKVRILVEHTAVLADAACAKVEARVLPRASGQTPTGFGISVRRAVIAADPSAAEARRAAAVRERRVDLWAGEDGMATLRAVLPVADALAAYRGTIPFTVLAGLRHDPAYLHGYGPITAQAARDLAADATWRRIITDPASGTVLDVGRTTYTPPAGLADHVRTRDRTCRFPGCRQPAARADLAHTIAYPNGPTAKHNLGALCRGDHRIKTLTTWTVTQDDQARLTWTSPTGQRHTTHPAEDLSEPDRPEAGPRGLAADNGGWVTEKRATYRRCQGVSTAPTS
jgi:hypothetical protein